MVSTRIQGSEDKRDGRSFAGPITYGLPVCPGRRDIDVGAGACLVRRRHGLAQPIVGTAFRAVDFGPGHSTMKQTQSDGVSGSANDTVESNREHKEE